MLIYDGDCGFCTLAAGWAQRRLPPGTPVVPWQAIPDLGAHGLTQQDVTRAAYWVDEHGGTYRGERGVAKALEPMGGGWAVAGRLVGAPPVRWLASLAYRLLARYRYRLPGGSAACRLPRS